MIIPKPASLKQPDALRQPWATYLLRFRQGANRVGTHIVTTFIYHVLQIAEQCCQIIMISLQVIGPPPYKSRRTCLNPL